MPSPHPSSYPCWGTPHSAHGCWLVLVIQCHDQSGTSGHLLLYEVLGQLVDIDHPVLHAIPKKLAREGAATSTLLFSFVLIFLLFWHPYHAWAWLFIILAVHCVLGHIWRPDRRPLPLYIHILAKNRGESLVLSVCGCQGRRCCFVVLGPFLSYYLAHASCDMLCLPAVLTGCGNFGILCGYSAVPAMLCSPGGRHCNASMDVMPGYRFMCCTAALPQHRSLAGVPCLTLAATHR